MLGQIGHPERHRPRRAHVAKHHDGAGHLSSAVVDGRGGILDGDFTSVAPDQDAVRGEAYGLVFPNRQRHGILRGFASGGIDDSEHFLDRVPCGLLPRPARHAFGDGVEIGHVAPDVGAHDRVADGVERDVCALLFLEQRLRDRRALDHAAQGLRQQVAVEAGLQQIVLCAMLYRQPGDILVLRCAEHQDRNLGRCAKEPIERLDAWLSGRKRSTNTAAMPSVFAFPLSFADQSFQTLGAASDPFDLEGSVGRIDQRVPNGLGIRGMFLDQKYRSRHKTFPADQGFNRFIEAGLEGSSQYGSEHTARVT